MLITDISPQTKDSHRENIFLDGSFGFGVSSELRFKHQLKPGQEISELKVKEIVFEDQIGKLFFSAQNFLSFRPRSEYEVRTHLKRKLEKGEFVDPEKLLTTVIDKLRKLDLVNDEAFARWWLEQRQKFRPRGERILRSELHQKRIPRDIIDEIFQAYQLPEHEIDKVAAKKLNSYSRLPEAQFRRKMSEYLVRKGYEWDDVKGVVDRLIHSR